MNERFFFSLEGVNIKDDNELEAFAAAVWEKFMAAQQKGDHATPGEAHE